MSGSCWRCVPGSVRTREGLGLGIRSWRSMRSGHPAPHGLHGTPTCSRRRGGAALAPFSQEACHHGRDVRLRHPTELGPPVWRALAFEGAMLLPDAAGAVFETSNLTFRTADRPVSAQVPPICAACLPICGLFERSIAAEVAARFGTGHRCDRARLPRAIPSIGPPRGRDQRRRRRTRPGRRWPRRLRPRPGTAARRLGAGSRHRSDDPSPSWEPPATGASATGDMPPSPERGLTASSNGSPLSPQPPQAGRPAA